MNADRAKKFQKEMAALYESLSFQDFYSVAKNKIIDALARGAIQGDSLSQVKRQVRKLFHSEFASYLDGVYERYTDTLHLVNDLYSDLGIDLTRDMQRILAIEAVNDSRFGRYEEATIREISRRVRKGIVAGDDWKTISKNIGKIDARANFYANTLGRTLVKGYARESKVIKADIAEVVWYQYVGIVRPQTRPFCYACVNAHFSRAELRLSKNGMIQPVLRFAGGYNCHHDLEPDPDYTDEQGEARGFGPIEIHKRRRIIKFFGTPEMRRRYDSQERKLKK